MLAYFRNPGDQTPLYPCILPYLQGCRATGGEGGIHLKGI